MTRRYLNSFPATDGHGRRYEVQVWVEILPGADGRECEGERSFLLHDGRRVTRLGIGRYRIEASGGPDLALTTDDPDAP